MCPHIQEEDSQAQNKEGLTYLQLVNYVLKNFFFTVTEKKGSLFTE